MRKFALLLGAMLLAAAPAFAADEAMAPATAPSEAPAVTTQAPSTPAAEEGKAATSPMEKGAKHKGAKKHMMHKARAKMHKGKGGMPTAEPASTTAQ
jgi:hypothetical protein